MTQEIRLAVVKYQRPFLLSINTTSFPLKENEVRTLSFAGRCVLHHPHLRLYDPRQVIPPVANQEQKFRRPEDRE